MRATVALSIAIVLAVPAIARADDGDDCLESLDELGVDYKPVRKRGIQIAVEVEGAIGGIQYVPYREGLRLVLDCSLVHALALIGPVLAEHGIDSARYSSAFERRNIRGTNRPSKHSFGLAIDVHTFLAGNQAYTIKEDYEQGLGDDYDCIGEPLTEAGRILRTIHCRLERSQRFRIVLTPDFDADHYNHFHIEAPRWDQRVELAPADGE